MVTRIFPCLAYTLAIIAFAAITSAFSLNAFPTYPSWNPSFLDSSSKISYRYQQSILKSSSALQEIESSSTPDDWANVIERDGFLRIDSALSADTSDSLRYYVEDQKILAWFAGMEAGVEGEEAAANRVFYGEKQSPTYCDLQLSVLRGGFAGDFAKNVSDTERHMLADVLDDVFGEEGSLTSLCEALVTTEGELYELAALVTEPGNGVEDGKVQSIVPFQNTPPLYSILLALDDFKENMGPITFYKGTHISEDRQNVDASAGKTSTLKKGDAIIYDARTLLSHSSNKASTSFLLNISFRNPKVEGQLGHTGSLRPGYSESMNLGDLTRALTAYKNGDGDAFEKYGDGIKKQLYDTESSSEIN